MTAGSLGAVVPIGGTRLEAEMAAKTRIDVSEIREKIDMALAAMQRIDGIKVTQDLRNNEQTANVSRELRAIVHYLDFARVLTEDEYVAYRQATARERRRGGGEDA